MRKSQELTIKLSEARERLNRAIEKRNGLPVGQDPDADLIGELDQAAKAIPPLEVEYRAAITAEAAEDEAAARENPDAQRREYSALEARCSVTAFMAEAVTDRPLTGPEAEYRREEMGETAAEGFLPLRLLAEPRTEERAEHRAVTPVADAAAGLGSQADIMGRIFERSIASQLRVAMPSVPMGTRTWPILTGGTTVSMQLKSGKQEAVAGTFTGTELSPVRLTGSYEFRVEDLQLLRGLEPALRRDLRALISDQMDDQILNGDGTAPNVSGFFNALADPTAASARATHATFVEAFSDRVDGKHAYSLGDVRAVIGKDTYGRMEASYRSTNADEAAFAYLSRRAGTIRVSNRMPAKASKKQEAVFALTSVPGTTATAPIWSAAQMIRDPYSLAQQGEVRITMLALWNFAILRSAGFARLQGPNRRLAGRLPMRDGLERRAFEFRASDDGGTVEGIVVPYGQPARIADFTERFLPGSLSFGDVIANRQHDRHRPLARTNGGGLTLTDSATELRARIELPDTQDGRDVRELVRLGVLRGLSR